MTLSLLLACSHNNTVVSSPSLGCSASQSFRTANFHRSYPAFDLPWLHTKKSSQFLLLALISPPRHIVCIGCAMSSRAQLHRVLQSSRDETTSGEEEEKRRKNLCLLNRQESFSLESFKSPRICLRHAILMDLRRENFSTIFFSSPLLLLLSSVAPCLWFRAMSRAHMDLRHWYPLESIKCFGRRLLRRSAKAFTVVWPFATATAGFQREIFVNFQKETRKK